MALATWACDGLPGEEPFEPRLCYQVDRSPGARRARAAAMDIGPDQAQCRVLDHAAGPGDGASLHVSALIRELSRYTAAEPRAGCRHRIACYERPRAHEIAAPEPPDRRIRRLSALLSRSTSWCRVANSSLIGRRRNLPSLRSRSPAMVHRDQRVQVCSRPQRRVDAWPWHRSSTGQVTITRAGRSRPVRPCPARGR